MTARVLVVDDEFFTLDTMQLLLNRYLPEVSVVLADGFDEAVATLMEQGPFSAVITDLYMGESDGERLLAWIRSGGASVGANGTLAAVPVLCYSCARPERGSSFDVVIRKTELGTDIRDIASHLQRLIKGELRSA